MIIVTGGAGFIGSNIVAGLQEAGHKNIVVSDWFGTDDKWRNVAKRELRDVVNPDELKEFLDSHAGEVEAIFHMGAISSTTETDVDLIVRNNVAFSRYLWRWCGENNVRLIYASSAATYGDGTKGFDDDESSEGLSKLQPLNAYGWSKHVFDRRVSRVIHDSDSVDESAVPPQWAGLKFFNVYGPNEYHKGDQMSVVCKLYPQVLNGAAAKLFKSPHPDYEDGGQIRDFVYVKDCVSVMLWLYDNPDVSGLFNVGTGKGRTFEDLANSVFAALGLEPKLQFIDMPQQLQDKYQYFTEANMKKLREAGYDTPFTELEDGIKDYVQSYLAEEDSYR